MYKCYYTFKKTFHNLFQKRMVHIEKSLSESVNLSSKLELLQLLKEPVILNESR